MNDSNTISVGKSEFTNDYTYTIEFEVPHSLKKYFLEEKFMVEYDTPIRKVPESILVLPLLSNILPIAWFNGIDILVEEIDESFYNTLASLKKAFQNMYPKLNVSGNLKANNIIRNNPEVKNKSAQLFSGGLDSLATFISKEEEKPLLVTVWGADIKLNETKAWEKVKDYNLKIADELDTEVFFIKSNLREHLDYRELGEKFGKLINFYHWWPGVQHSIALAGLSAPLTYIKGIQTFYIPSSYTIDFKHPWGSDPSIDNEIKWANLNVIHEGYSLSRQKKVNLISDFIRNKKPDLQIRVCWQSGINGGNCNKCEKCSRTIVGLLMAGIEPENHGFRVSNNFSILVKKNIENEKWVFSEDEVFMWEDIQKSIKTTSVDKTLLPTELFMWLQNYKFKKYQPNKMKSVKRILLKIYNKI